MRTTSVTVSVIFVSTMSFAVPFQIDKTTGLVIDNTFPLVKAHCTACHSAKLVTQNRMSRENWLNTIRWMQKEQGLWPLGNGESAILDYLAKHYAPLATSRRAPIPKHLMPLPIN